MGREIKRVAAGFNWPLGKVWRGFVDNPHRGPKKCRACEGTGSSTVARHLKDLWYGYVPFKPEDRGSKPHLPTDVHVLAFARRQIERAPEYYGTGELAVAREAQRLCALWNKGWAYHLSQRDVDALVEGGRLVDFTHTCKSGEGWKLKNPPCVPTAAEVNVWSCVTMGHDCINQWTVIRAECKRLGVSRRCGRCGETGEIWSSRGAKLRYERWEPIQPPAGEWWQLWETVSEGSPVTPAFATREELIDYLVEGGDCSDRKYGEGGWKRENAESFVEAGWGPSFFGMAGDVRAPRDGQRLAGTHYR